MSERGIQKQLPHLRVLIMDDRPCSQLAKRGEMLRLKRVVAPIYLHFVHYQLLGICKSTVTVHRLVAALLLPRY